ncbi:F-box domain-containing protein [Mycena venus]|uniref:F-box domain-containing protein n=1 Tax=Mycena venus TaxID=2733690 RepID=A0A8H7D2L1_9AGAR|nr:F-box domain-containing protein [Mycena venus]
MSTTFYPVLTLPPEITGQFFLYCIPVPSSPYAHLSFAWIRYSWEDYKQKLPQAAPPPWDYPLSQVCRSWRGIALDTPALWAAFPLKASSLRSHHPSIESWLTRARDCPLTFTWSSSDIGEHMQQVLYSFQDTAHWMGDVDLAMPIHEFEMMARSSVPWHFPVLQTLSLHVPDWCYSLQSPPVRVSAPLLRDLSTYGWNPEACLFILSLTPKLLECRFSVFSEKGSWHTRPTPSPIPGTRVALPHLHTLTLFGSYGPECEEAGHADILDYLTLPTLHTLKAFDLDPETDPCFLDAFLVRCTPPLRSLVLHKRGGTAIDVGVFGLMPELARLEIWRPSAEFMAVLAEDVFTPGGTRLALPQLQRLMLIGRLGSHESSASDVWEQGSWTGPWGEHDLIFLPFKTLTAEEVEVCIEG